MLGWSLIPLSVVPVTGVVGCSFGSKKVPKVTIPYAPPVDFGGYKPTTNPYVASVDTTLHNITGVHDGDTFTIDGKQQIRLFGVDTPELSYFEGGTWKESTSIEHKWGILARDYVKNAFASRQITKMWHMWAHTFNRNVASLMFGMSDVAIEILKKGLGVVRYINLRPGNKFFTPDTNYYNSLIQAQEEAKRNHKGVWSGTDNLANIYKHRPINI